MSYADDELVEKMCGARIDAWMAAKGWTYERTTDKKEQCAGIDAWLTLDGRRRAVDEKAKHSGLQPKNKFGLGLGSVSFEVNRVCRDGERMPGWFCASNIKTELYLFSFPYFNDVYDKSMGIMLGMKMWLFEKSDVEELAAQQGLEKDTLDARAKDMLERGLTRLDFGPLALYKSGRLEEAPVNLIIPCGLLRGMKSFRELTA